MHPLHLRVGVVAAFLLSGLVPVPLRARPAVGRSEFPPTGRYPLFALDPTEVSSNRVQYGVDNRGNIGFDAHFSTSITVGFWPRGTGNQYIFNSGVQVAGIVGGTRATNPWAGDTSMALFFDPSGLRSHGTGVTPLANAAVPSHRINWPQAAYLPHGAEGALFADVLAGQASAGDADVWYVAWEGDPSLNSARPHPLGIVAEHRIMGWNAPRGNEDMLYLLVTFYNVTARDASAYAAYRPGLREILAAQAEAFHQRNEEKFGVDLPDAGWTIDPFYVSLAADPDVTNSAGTNFASVNMPLAMSFAWHADFPRAAGWTFPADLFAAPFAARSGLIGFAMLRNLQGAPSLNFHTALTNGGAVPDINSSARALRYMSGDVAGDPGISCNTGTPSSTRICLVGGTPNDVRSMQSSPAIALAAGASASAVWAYVHAAPVAVTSAPMGTRIFPGDPTRLSRAAELQSLGANVIDSIAGYAGFVDDNANGEVEGREFRTVPRSLLAKAQLAQAFFAHRFLAPAAPESPDFFLVPGDGAVTVAWRPSRTDEVGDPYFTVASQALTTPSGGGAPVPNPLYDPNYRQFDVEGYRIWRGRTDAPNALELVAQFDHVGTVFRDYGAQVTNHVGWNRCAPELGITTDCAGKYDPPVPGVARTRYVSYDLDGIVRQVAIGDRIALPNGEIEPLAVDTVDLIPPTSVGDWSNSGVPYVWRDSTVRNGLTYFYAVTAFDVNAINSTGAGRTSLESPRITRRVTPRQDATNHASSISVRTYLRGRTGELNDTVTPTINSFGGRLSKRFPIANGFTVTPLAPLAEVLGSRTSGSVRLDSARITSLVESGSNLNVSLEQHFTVDPGNGSAVRVMVPLQLSQSGGASINGYLPPVLVSDPVRTAQFGGAQPTGSTAAFSVRWPSLHYTTLHGRGCLNNAPGFGSQGMCEYNGARWFDGFVETQDHPNGDNVGLGATPTRFNNAGALSSARTIYNPQSYNMTPTSWRRVDAALGAFAGGADYRVWWGVGGVIDSVIDLTHDVPVPFDSQMGLSWGVLNGDAVPAGDSYDQRAALTYTDATCVQPLRSLDLVQSTVACSGAAVALERTVRPGPVAFAGGSTYTNNRTANVAQGQGFLLYLKGRLFLIELLGSVPQAGTGWTLRDYVGAIAGGRGVAGDYGPYHFVRESYMYAPLTAVGAQMVVEAMVSRTVAAPGALDLSRVHTVPDPYYHRVDAGVAALRTGITFVNLPDRATIRIYSSSGVLVRVLSHASRQEAGETTWDLTNRSGRAVASGVYFYQVAVEGAQAAVGRMAVVR